MKALVPLLLLLTYAAQSQALTKPSQQAQTEGAYLDCECFDGIGSSKGDKPVTNISFSNGIILTICGYQEEHERGESAKVSEFDIFDCQNGDVLATYDALQQCDIHTKLDTLIIDELKYLPVGENWQWEYVTIAKEVFYPEGKIVVSYGQMPFLGKIEIDEETQRAFTSELKVAQGYPSDWEEELGKLEVLALIGNPTALEVLKNYEGFCGEPADGALAEQWKSAVATVEFIRGL